jgi:prepilin-type N-terminal cleavage/methylation domain-containing protein
MTNRRVLSQKGFSLVEILLALALMASLGLVASKLLEMIENNSKASALREAQMSYYVRGVNVLDLNLRGLKRHQFNKDLFYKIVPSTGRLIQNSASSNPVAGLLSLITSTTKPLAGIELLNAVPSNDAPLTSFVFQKKIGADYFNYTAVCLPLSKVWDNAGITYESISKNELWPFIKKVNNSIKVFCCKRTDPNCSTNPVLTHDSKYTIQVFRRNPSTQELTPLLRKNDFKQVSGMGYFIFSNTSSETSLYARFIVFYNQCISQKIIKGESQPNCKTSTWFKSTELLKEFDYASEGVSNLGGEIGI